MKIKSTFKKIKKRASKMLKVYNKVLSGEITNRADRELYAVTNNPSKYNIEFDQLKREFPDTYRIYLNEMLIAYKSYLEYDIDGRQLLLSGNKEIVLLNYFTCCLDVIIKHLTELLNPETEAQEQPNPIKPPKGQTQLNRNQTGLLFWYLREKSLILPKAENQNISKAIELMTGHSAGIMDNILKKPQTDVCKLGKGNLVNKNDFDILINELENLIKRIKTDRRTNIEKGELN